MKKPVSLLIDSLHPRYAGDAFEFVGLGRPTERDLERVRGSVQRVQPLVEHDASLAHYLDPLAQRLNLGKDVSGKHHPVVLAQLVNERAYFADLVGIQPGGGLIQHHHQRIVDDRLGDPHALLIPLG